MQNKVALVTGDRSGIGKAAGASEPQCKADGERGNQFA